MNRFFNGYKCVYYNKSKVKTELDLVKKGVDITTTRVLLEFIKDEKENKGIEKFSTSKIPNKIIKLI